MSNNQIPADFNQELNLELLFRIDRSIYTLLFVGPSLKGIRQEVYQAVVDVLSKHNEDEFSKQYIDLNLLSRTGVKPFDHENEKSE